MGAPTGLVLAGGRGLRLGGPKGELVVEGRTLALRAARTLRPLCGRVLISLRPGAANPAPGWPAIEDLPPAGRGPLAGIHAAFEAVGRDDLLVLACDYPRVGTSLLQALLERADPKAVLVYLAGGDGREHPLVGLWRGTVAPRVAAALEAGRYKVRAAAKGLPTQVLGPDDLPDLGLDRALFNLNDREDLDALAQD